jgi:hypothetical protein
MMNKKIRIWKEKRPIRFYRMWRGQCDCGKTWQFWFFGATLGYGLEHQRRCGR